MAGLRPDTPISLSPARTHPPAGLRRQRIRMDLTAVRQPPAAPDPSRSLATRPRLSEDVAIFILF